jgi:hypothetical protein
MDGAGVAMRNHGGVRVPSLDKNQGGHNPAVPKIEHWLIRTRRSYPMTFHDGVFCGPHGVDAGRRLTSRRRVAAASRG